MRMMLITFAAVAFSFTLGCQDETGSTEKFWKPLPEQIQKAEIIAQKYAEIKLKVPKDILERAKYSAYGFYRDGRKIVYLEFFDPEFFPDWENKGGMLGGFPHYYCISVDCNKMKVVDSYACEE
ncbi:MAG: hypothetical protein ISS71_09500 [Phycisphaerae bacterium]|nr:hypothetical protein [Phycisphaerae bacterium]